jgi:hypothetical protein
MPYMKGWNSGLFFGRFHYSWIRAPIGNEDPDPQESQINADPGWGRGEGSGRMSVYESL